MIDTIMITGIGTSTSQNFVKAIRAARPDIRFIGLDMDPINSGSFLVDCFETVPAAKHSSFVDSVKELVKKHRPQLFVPVVDYEFLALVDQDIGAKTTLPTKEAIAVCDDKRASIEAFVRAGVYSPPIVAAKDHCWPKMVRPQFDGRASIGAAKVNTLSEWAEAASNLESPITTKYITGQEVTVDVLCDESSNVLAYAPRERLDVKSGVAYKSHVYHGSGLKQQVQNICKTFGLKYLNCMQAIRVRDENHTNPNYWETSYWWFEVNPRFGGGSAATTVAGLNLPYLLIKHLTNEFITPDDLAYSNGTSVRALKEFFIDD